MLRLQVWFTYNLLMLHLASDMSGLIIRITVGAGITRNMDGIADGVERMPGYSGMDFGRKNAGLKPAFFIQLAFLKLRSDSLRAALRNSHHRLAA